MYIPRPIYSCLLYVAAPLAMLYLLKRGKKQPEYKENWDERFGTATYPARRKGRTRVWIHAVSVGETRAAFPLMDEILARWPNVDILLTCMTPTGRDVGRSYEKKYGARVELSYLPYDTPYAVKKFIKATEPSICLLMETEVWPNLTYIARQMELPVLLVNGRLSEKSLNQAKKLSSLLKPAMQRLTVTLAQSQADAERLALAGAENIQITGNLKFDFTPNHAQVQTAYELKKQAERPVILLASTREGEEEMFLEALREKADVLSSVNPLLLMVPRHPQRFNDVEGMIKKAGFSVERRSNIRDWKRIFSSEGPQMVLGDSMGEMGFYYGLADVAVMGGSYAPFGSQSMIEPCAVGVPTVVGPSTFNFATAVAGAEKKGAILRAADAAEALVRAAELLNDPQQRNAVSEAAKHFFEQERGATEKTMKVIEKVLNEKHHEQ